MFIVEVAPFSKGLKKPSLSYFSKNFIEPGVVVRVNIRGKSETALVLESKNAAELKSELRGADFQLKKITSLTSLPFLTKEFLEAVDDTGKFFVYPKGAILGDLLPSFILENPQLLSLIKNKVGKEKPTTDKSHPRIEILQAEEGERFLHYRTLIREEFAKNKSVFLCISQNENIKKAREFLERGIESFTVSFYGGKDAKTLKEEWKKVCTESHPLLIIGTPRWLFIPREDIGVMVLEGENESGWMTLSRPYFDLRYFVERFATHKNIFCILGDSYLRTETLFRYKEGHLAEFKNVKWRLRNDIETQIVDLKESTKKEKEFKVFSPQALKLITNTLENNSRIFLFASRKGLSGTTVCKDCGNTVKCSNCEAPMVLYKIKDGGIFRCHQCGEVRDAAEVCKYCGSWRLFALGVGIDKVSEEIRREFENAPLFEFSSDTISTSKQAETLIKNFYETKGSVLLGTEMALPYLHKKVENTAIISFDSLFSIPDFRIREKIFRIILGVKNAAKESFLIQTRNPEEEVIQHAATGNLQDFYKKEIDDRKLLLYPPFGVFIKITVRGNRKFVEKEASDLKNIFDNLPESKYKPAIFSSVHEKRGEQMAVNFVIKLPIENWPNNELSSLLQSLPPHFEIKVDPDNLL